MLDEEHGAVRVDHSERGVAITLQCQTLTQVIVTPFGLGDFLLDMFSGAVIRPHQGMDEGVWIQAQLFAWILAMTNRAQCVRDARAHQP